MSEALDRAELHLPLYENRYSLLVPQYAAQQASGRFLPGERLTSGSHEIDNMVASQYTRMYVPLVCASPAPPSVIKIHEAGTPYQFATQYEMIGAYRVLSDYLNEAVGYYNFHMETLIPDVYDAIRRLSSLADSMSSTLNAAGCMQETSSVLGILDIMMGKTDTEMKTMPSTKYETAVMHMRRRNGL